MNTTKLYVQEVNKIALWCVHIISVDVSIEEGEKILSGKYVFSIEFIKKIRIVAKALLLTHRNLRITRETPTYGGREPWQFLNLILNIQKENAYKLIQENTGGQVAASSQQSAINVV